MKIMKQISIISLVIALSACVYIPVTDKTAITEPSCQTYTKKMTVMELREASGKNTGMTTSYDKGRGWSGGGCGSGESCLAILAAATAVAAGTFIVSGSIVVINNTAHWLEYQGTCSDGYLNVTKQRFLESVNKPTPAI
jgi:hypothetical protein